MSVALFTPVVLDQIFGNLNVSELKEIRSVCKTWADVGASHLGRRTTLCTQFIHPYRCLEEPEEISLLLNPKLGKSIRVLGDGKLWAHMVNPHDADEVINTNYSSQVVNLFLQLVSRVHHQTTNIDLKNIKIGGASPLIEAFSSFDFPELTSLTLHNDQDMTTMTDIEEHEVFQDIYDLPPFPEMSSLTTISYAIGLPVPWPAGAIRANPFRLWLQACVNSAQNLQGLTIIDNFYPDLASCGNTLKSLRYDGWPVKRIWDPRFMGFCASHGAIDEAFNLDEVVRMVAQVSGSIETLRLGISNPEINGSDRSCKFESKPSVSPTFFFPNLTHLELGSLEYFGLFTKTFVELAKTAPNLKHITLRTMQFNYHDYPDTPVESVLGTISLSGPHPKIESLSLIFHNNVNSNLIKNLKLGAVFPSLKYLELTIPGLAWVEGTEPESELWEKIECLNNWRKSLTQLKLEMNMWENLEKAVHSMKCLAKFAAETKVITIKGKGEETTFPKTSENIEASLRLLVSGGMKSLTLDNIGIHISDIETLLWMKETSQFPIFFKECWYVKEGLDWVSSIQHPIPGIDEL